MKGNEAVALLLIEKGAATNAQTKVRLRQRVATRATRVVNLSSAHGCRGEVVYGSEDTHGRLTGPRCGWGAAVRAHAAAVCDSEEQEQRGEEAYSDGCRPSPA